MRDRITAAVDRGRRGLGALRDQTRSGVTSSRRGWSRALGGLKRSIQARLLGPPEVMKKRVLNGLILASVAIVVLGVAHAMTTDVDKLGASSLPVLRPALKILTSTWLLPVLIAYIGRSIILGRRKYEARQAAAVTGYSTRSIERIGEEVKHSDQDTRTRVIATSDDDVETIRDRIARGLEGGEDDTLDTIRAEYAAAKDDVPELQEDDVDDELAAIDADLADLDAKIEDLKEEMDDEIAAISGTPPAEPLEEPPEEYDPVDVLADLLAGNGTDLDANDRARIQDLEAKLDELEGLHAEYIELLEERESHLDERLEDVDSEIDELQDEEDVDERDLWEQWKLFELDVSTSLNFESILWRFGVPAGTTFFLIMVAVQFWIQPLFYLPIIAVSVLVGLGNYIRVERQRTRRLATLRADSKPVQYDDLAIFVKEVDVPETRIQVARMAGRTYAHDGREEFTRELAIRAYELVNGLEPSPSVMQKQADQLAQYRPDLAGYRDAERERIAIALETAVESTTDGLVPKQKLIEECIKPAPSGWLPFSGGGRGYDPELVQEMYRELVPGALVEIEVPISEDEGAPTVTSVRLRDDPLPAGYGAVLAQFSSQFANYADREPEYELPDVSDRLEDEPLYADRIGALA